MNMKRRGGEPHLPKTTSTVVRSPKEPTGLRSTPWILSARDTRLWELVSTGSSGKAIAEQMGMRAGTIRVYLHNLYKTLGVHNKSEAAVLYVNMRELESRPAAEATAPLLKSFGDFAYETNLAAALGADIAYLGVHGLLEGALPAASHKAAEKITTKDRIKVRALWEAMIAGNFSVARDLYESGEVPFTDQPVSGLVTAVMLTVGGYSRAAMVYSKVFLRKRATQVLSERDAMLLLAVTDAVERRKPAAFSYLARVAALRPNDAHDWEMQLAQFALYYIYRIHGERARAIAFAELVNKTVQEAKVLAQSKRPDVAAPYGDISLATPTQAVDAATGVYTAALRKRAAGALKV